MTEQTTKPTKLIIIEALRDMGMGAHLKGYTYLKDAIEMVLADGEKYRRAMGNLYIDIAKRHKVSQWSRVERCMRSAIEFVFDRYELELLYKIFGSAISTKSGKPTNTEFLHGVAEYVRVQRGDYDDV